MSLSMIDHVPSPARLERTDGHRHAPRHRPRNARRALALRHGLAPTPGEHGVRLHPAELGPWDD